MQRSKVGFQLEWCSFECCKGQCMTLFRFEWIGCLESVWKGFCGESLDASILKRSSVSSTASFCELSCLPWHLGCGTCHDIVCMDRNTGLTRQGVTNPNDQESFSTNSIKVMLVESVNQRHDSVAPVLDLWEHKGSTWHENRSIGLPKHNDMDAFRSNKTT